MKYLFLSLIMSILVGASVCCAPPQVKTAEQQQKEFVNSLQEKTVALVKESSDGGIFPYCSGVWVAKDLILTAHHCFDGEETLSYKTFTDKSFEGRIAFPVKEDKLNDLILLKAVDGASFDHPFAKVAESDWTGEKVHIVGHPNGLWWTYFAGEVSSKRRIYDGAEDKYQRLLQISAPVWRGNSGGGAFDKNGNLVGISSWIMVDVPMMAFFIHREAISEFLASSTSI